MDSEKTYSESIRISDTLLFLFILQSMAGGKGLLAILCALQNSAIIGFCIYQVGWGKGPKEVWLAIIAGVIGCVSNKIRQNVFLPSTPV